MHQQWGLAQAFAVVAAASSTGSRSPMGLTHWEMYVTGAAMIEMIAEGSLYWREKMPVVLSHDHDSAQLTGKTLLAQTLQQARKPKTFKAWMQYFYHHAPVRRSVVQECVQPVLEEGALRFETRKVLRIFRTTHSVADAVTQEGIVLRLRSQMLGHEPLDEQTAVLAMLLESAKLLHRYFSAYERQTWKSEFARLQMEQSEQWKRVTEIRKAIQEMESSGASGGVFDSSGGDGGGGDGGGGGGGGD